MKTTIDIPTEELEEAMRHTGASTKKEAVVTAVADFNRRKRLEQLVEEFGKSKGFMTRDELRRMREER